MFFSYWFDNPMDPMFAELEDVRYGLAQDICAANGVSVIDALLETDRKEDNTCGPPS